LRTKGRWKTTLKKTGQAQRVEGGLGYNGRSKESSYLPRLSSFCLAQKRKKLKRSAGSWVEEEGEERSGERMGGGLFLAVVRGKDGGSEV
jgi:hypothetical protein